MAGRVPDCIFCDAEDRMLLSNALAFATRDNMPVSRGHTLIIPQRHCTDFFELTSEEIKACFELLCAVREELESRPDPPDGYNVGVNVGTAGGQGVPHVHLHLIPRYRGDIAEPRGGIRNILPCHRPEHDVS